MSSASYLIRKSLGNIVKRPLSLLTSLVSLILLFLMANIVWISYLSSHQYYQSLNAEINMEAFISDSLADSAVTDLVDSVSAIDGIEYIVFISKDDARSKLNDLMGTDLLEGIEINPLPRSIIIDFDDSYINSEFMSEISRQISELNGINEIFYPAELLEMAEYSRNLIDQIIIFLLIVIWLA
ncbi:MAG: permease-like cell division protein FtsX, partial [Candidatus Zixiibacteriota bacterium]